MLNSHLAREERKGRSRIVYGKNLAQNYKNLTECLRFLNFAVKFKAGFVLSNSLREPDIADLVS